MGQGLWGRVGVPTPHSQPTGDHPHVSPSSPPPPPTTHTHHPTPQLHHLLNNGAEVNQRDEKGFTPLHRAAYLAHFDGYLEIYEYLLSRGADPAARTNDYDPYLSPGRKLPVEVAVEEDAIRSKLLALEEKYAGVAKAPLPHHDIGCWWALYDYGLDRIKAWAASHKQHYPGVAARGALTGAGRRACPAGSCRAARPHIPRARFFSSHLPPPAHSCDPSQHTHLQRR